jgi:hypothetical protein
MKSRQEVEKHLHRLDESIRLGAKGKDLQINDIIRASTLLWVLED